MSMEMSDSTATDTPMVSFEEKFANVNYYIGNIQKLLSEYKIHQAREDLLVNSQTQLDHALALEHKLEKLLEESKHKLESVNVSVAISGDK